MNFANLFDFAEKISAAKTFFINNFHFRRGYM